VADLNKNGAIDTTDQTTTYTYADPHNASLVTRIQYPDGDTVDDNVKFTYNMGGQLMTRTAQKPAGGTANVITFAYDPALGRLEKQRVTTLGTGVDSTIRSIKYSFDNLGRRQKITSYSDDNCTTAVNEVGLEYTDLGALAAEYQEHTGVKGGGTLAVRYTYDVPAKNMRLTDVTYPNGRKSFRDYGPADSLSDKISRLSAIKDSIGSQTVITYAYNGVGTIVREEFGQSSVRLDYFGGTSGTYAGFDRFGRIKQQLWRDFGVGADSDKFVYEYDYNSNRKFRQNVVAGATNKKLDELYAYDNLDRLVDFKRGKLNVYNTDIPVGDRLRSEEWMLTDTGNWQTYLVDATGDGTYTDPTDLNQTRTHNLANELTGINVIAGQTNWANPTHDSRGNMVSVPKPSAMNGTYTCAYDSWNRLTKVTDGQTVVAEYRYDGFDRRIRKFVPSGQNWTVTEYYYSASWQVLETRRNTMSRSGEPALASTLYEQYVWSPRYIDSPILRDRSTTGNGTLNERRYYLTDAQSNVTTLLNAAGDPVERYTYDPYGKITIYDGTWTNVLSASASDNEVLFCGYRRDTETGLYHVRNRMYHPLLGRWIQRDPLGYVDGLNLYEYCRTSPTNGVDPFGFGNDDYIQNGMSPAERMTAQSLGMRTSPPPPVVAPPRPEPSLEQLARRSAARAESMRRAEANMRVGQNIVAFTANEIVPRAIGGVQAIGGILTMAGGVVLVGGGAAAEVPSVGTSTVAIVGGVVLIGVGFDNAYAGLQTAISGNPTATLLYQSTESLVGPTGATIIDTGTGFLAAGTAGNALGKLPKVRLECNAGGAAAKGMSPAAAETGVIDAASVRFSQDSISRVFQNGDPIADLVTRLRSGTIDPTSIPPIRLVQQDGLLYTLDNRRLWAFQQAGVKVPYRMATEKEIAREVPRKLKTQNEGASVRIRGEK